MRRAAVATGAASNGARAAPPPTTTLRRVIGVSRYIGPPFVRVATPSRILALSRVIVRVIVFPTKHSSEAPRWPSLYPYPASRKPWGTERPAGSVHAGEILDLPVVLADKDPLLLGEAASSDVADCVHSLPVESVLLDRASVAAGRDVGEP